MVLTIGDLFPALVSLCCPLSPVLHISHNVGFPRDVCFMWLCVACTIGSVLPASPMRSAKMGHVMQMRIQEMAVWSDVHWHEHTMPH